MCSIKTWDVFASYKKWVSAFYTIVSHLWQYTDACLDNTEQTLRFILQNSVDDLTLNHTHKHRSAARNTQMYPNSTVDLSRKHPLY